MTDTERGAPPAAMSAGYLQLVRGNANFRYLWIGQIISLLGDWFNLIASAALIGMLTGSGVAVGGLFVVRMLAPFLISPIAGVAADRYDRRRLLILTDLARAVTVLGFLLVREPEDVWLLYVLTFVQLAISGVFFPTRTAILPDLVPTHDLGAANALTSATWSVMLALGAALGGFVAGKWGIYPAFVIDALTFLLSAAVLWRIQYTHDPSSGAAGRSVIDGVREYARGLRYLTRVPDVLVNALHKFAVAVTVAGGFQVVQVSLSQQVYVMGEGGSTSLGIMYAVLGIGSGLGPIAARRFTGDRDRALRVAIGLAYVVTALGLAITAPLFGFAWVLLGTLLRAVGGGMNWVFSTQLLLHGVAAPMRGRVFAFEFAMFTLGAAIGAAAAGWLLDNSGLGLQGLLWAMAVIALIPGALWAVWMARGHTRSA